MELRARDERAVLVGHDGTGEREVDPHTLALGGDLSAALHEWARVAGAVRRTDADLVGAGVVVSHRGLQLAGRVATAMGTPISYVDPLTGEVSVVEPPATATEAPAEPTPWATGLTVAAFTLVLVLFAILTLAGTLYETSPFLAIGSNIVITGGLLPSVWLARRVAVWRWVAAGVAGGIALGWLGLPFILFG
ncbi:DUF2537 domain-containing protein [Actinokineospora sp.]|uniref:DUF2537 domain-containing protein n=1 Tax=Actinokineospora sp. TaxID=1872133 RepID=UPI004037CE5C